MSGSARMVLSEYSGRSPWLRHHPGRIALNRLRVLHTADMRSATLNLTDATMVATGAHFVGLQADQLPQEVGWFSSIGNISPAADYTEANVTPAGPYLAPRSGFLQRITLQYSAAIQAGTLTVQPTINGANAALPATLSVGEQRGIFDFGGLPIDISANDLVGFTISSSALFAPVSAQTHLSVQFYVSMGSNV